MRLIFLILEGPLQSWGDHSRWDDRDSGASPTKSGIIGMLGCCMGLERGDTKTEDLHRRLKIAVRRDRPGTLLMDFHTVQKKGMLKADGKELGKGVHTIVSHRQYLQDAAFLVAIAGDDTLLDEIKHALLHPVWPPYLGRKSCVPSRPILDGDTDEYATMTDAIKKYPLIRRDGEAAEYEEGIIAEIEDDTGIYSRNDFLTDAEKRIYAKRSYNSVYWQRQEA